MTPTRGEVLALKLRDHPWYFLHPRCQCTRVIALPFGFAARPLPEDATVEHAVRRLRCNGCGQRPYSVWVTDAFEFCPWKAEREGFSPYPGPTWKVELVPPFEP